MKIKLANNKEYPVISDGAAATCVDPSDNPSYRSKMHICMAENAMQMEEFADLFTNPDNLKTITFKGDGFETEYRHYTVTQSVGKELVKEVDPATGAVAENYCLVAKLEQLTYIEQQLAALGL